MELEVQHLDTHSSADVFDDYMEIFDICDIAKGCV